MDISKKDWKLFRERLADRKENHMEDNYTYGNSNVLEVQ